MPSNESIERAVKLIANDKSKVLRFNMGKHVDVETGKFIPKADAQTQPELFITTPSSTGTYIAIGLDLDAPFPGFFTALGPILHWIQPGLKAGPDGKLTSSEPFIANYIGPAPPPGSSPHRYSFFVYEQPDGLDIQKYAPADGKKLGNWNRMRFSLDDWEKEIKLGSVLAFNYFNSN